MKVGFENMIVKIILKLLALNLKRIQNFYYRFAGELLKQVE
ncbi:hypothetical protein HMPREF0669_02052 [Prevotella sp. oral taxon 299 str. F0039]|nr:hypothetical protein HMPREF0669_02052 [Prevotella sp. oral taxon 299 str. F0039]